uniref:Uncharacterized protein n=1 Tax=Arion vulgaris TaxID=1028688 RepID=A0A0B7ALI8_9EUPU
MCLRAAEYPMVGRMWPAGRSLPTPAIDLTKQRNENMTKHECINCLAGNNTT